MQIVSLFLDMRHQLTKTNAVRSNGIVDFCRRHFALIVFISIIIVYIPYFFAVYPGIYSYDASPQTAMLFGKEPLTLKHPIVHTLLLYGCIRAGQVLCHNNQAGMVIYSVIQSLVVARGITFLITKLRQKNAPIWLFVATWLYLVVNPYIAVFSFITTKDVIFGIFFMLLFCQTCELCNDPKRIRQHRFAISYTLLIIAMCLFRNQGLYVYLLFALLFLIKLIITARKQHTMVVLSRFVAVSFVAVLIVYLIGTAIPVSCSVKKGNAREALSVPMQQIAFVYNKDPQVMTPTEKAYIERLIAPKYLTAYVPQIADPVKSGFHIQVLKQNPKAFVKMYGALWRKDKQGYLKAFYDMAHGNWDLRTVQYWDQYIYYDGVMMDARRNVLGIYRASKWPAFDHLLAKITLTPAFSKVPVLNVLLHQALPFWVSVAVFVTGLIGGIRRCKYQTLQRCQSMLPLVLIFGYFVTLLLGPVTGIRYTLPLMYCLPVLVYMLITNIKQI